MKVFKKLMAVVLAAIMLNVGITVEDAEAAEFTKCGQHPDYYDTVMSGIEVGYEHYVEKKYYVLDEDGAFVDLSELTGEHYYVRCTVTLKDLYVIVRCVKCHYQIGGYRYSTPEVHSYCDNK